jgi:GNAT superfamily N-acetyltransferase
MVARDALRVPIRIDDSFEAIDWMEVKADLAADDFDNGHSPEALRLSFARSQHVVFARDGARVVGMARLLSDGVCNAYLLDVWTASSHRRQGIGSRMVRQLAEQVPGQHIGLQTDDAANFYRALDFRPQPEFFSLVVGGWLENEATAAECTSRGPTGRSVACHHRRVPGHRRYGCSGSSSSSVDSTSSGRPTICGR